MIMYGILNKFLQTNTQSQIFMVGITFCNVGSCGHKWFWFLKWTPPYLIRRVLDNYFIITRVLREQVHKTSRPVTCRRRLDRNWHEILNTTHTKVTFSETVTCQRHFFLSAPLPLRTYIWMHIDHTRVVQPGRPLVGPPQGFITATRIVLST